MVFQYRLVATGGTFDRFHKGHAALLDKAFSVGEKVIIGVTSDWMVRRKPRILKETVLPYQKRVADLKKHLKACRELKNKLDVLEKSLKELTDLNQIFNAIVGMADAETANKEPVAFILKDEEKINELVQLLTRFTGQKAKLKTVRLPDGNLVAVTTVEKQVSEKLRKAMQEKSIPDYTVPEELQQGSLSEKINFIRKKTEELTLEKRELEKRLKDYAVRWMPIYNQTLLWIRKRLSVISAMASVFETKMCFLVYGWIPSKDYRKLETKIKDTFKGAVLVRETEIREEDLERVPVMLKNPPYFKPFEIFVRIFPLPKYTTYDPTPFVGIFFPLFFGMILGDVGYGVVLMMISFFLSRKYRENQSLSDVAKILFVCSLYSVFFGVLYGEFFGNLPHQLFGIEPLWVERRSAVVPVLYFAISMGVVHILLGLVLGVLSALKRHSKKEALFRAINIALILCVLLLVIALTGLFPFIVTKPVIIAMMILSPFLLFTGGLLAPLEVIKSIGNIISYARIMAIGMTSVLISYVANKMAGMIGNVVAGIVVAVLLHLINVVLGIFSPTVHSLRLHYVEFFSKFIEQGGRKYEPLK